MHLIGTWNKLSENQLAQPGDFSFLKLRVSNSVTIVEDDRRKLIYEGIIFDATNQQLLDDPTLLDQAFGYYTYVLLEKNLGRAFLGTDKLGFSPVYYAWEGETFHFSSSLTLLKYELGKATPNLDAWDEIFTIGDILGDKTVIKEATRLRWGRKFRMSAHRVDTKDIWDPEVPVFSDRQTYIRVNNELLVEAMELTKSCDRPKFVMLSGGDDSRRIAVAAHHVGLPITCVTQEAVGKGASDKDVLVADAVCRFLRVPHIRVPRASHGELYNDRIVQRYWDAYEADHHGWVFPLLRHIPKGAAIYDGIVADVTVNGHYFRAYPELVTRFDEVDYATRLLCGPRQSGIDPKLVSAPLFERVRAELARYPDSPHRLTYYFLLNHTRRCIGSSWFTLFYAFGHMPCPPYMYYPFLIQSLSLEPRYYLEAWMQNECLKELNPAAAAIPTTRNEVPADYVIDLKSEWQSWLRFEARHHRIRRDATRYFPGFKKPQRLFEAMSLIGLRGHADRWSWAPTALAQFTEFLDWIEDRQAPEFPVQRDASAFCTGHFVK